MLSDQTKKILSAIDDEYWDWRQQQPTESEPEPDPLAFPDEPLTDEERQRAGLPLAEAIYPIRQRLGAMSMRCKCGNRLSEEEENEGMCSSCMWAEEMEFLETAYAEDIAERAKASEEPHSSNAN